MQPLFINKIIEYFQKESQDKTDFINALIYGTLLSLSAIILSFTRHNYYNLVLHTSMLIRVGLTGIVNKKVIKLKNST